MSRFNTSTNHPLIPSAQQYMIEKKYVSIHSEDRDNLRYPYSNEFEIELPQDYLNVQSVKLSTWTFPANYNSFSVLNKNTIMTFQFDQLYNPTENFVADPLINEVYNILYYYKNQLDTNDIIVIISDGFYNPTQLSTELTNRFNQAVTNIISLGLVTYDTTNGTALSVEFLEGGGYNDFVIVYNEVEQKLYFGNRSSTFIITNDTQVISRFDDIQRCANTYKEVELDFSNWGLPVYLGFSKCPVKSELTLSRTLVPGTTLPRFYYGDVQPGDNGYWITPNPNLPNAEVSFLVTPSKLNNMGQSYIYMEIEGMNCIDETRPYSVSPFTVQTNQTNGTVNSAFAKIAVTTTPLAQWFDNGCDSYKFYNPPAERIRKLKFKFRYHNGALLNFGYFPFSFTLEFTLLTPQSMRNMTTFNSYTTI